MTGDTREYCTEWLFSLKQQTNSSLNNDKAMCQKQICWSKQMVEKANIKVGNWRRYLAVTTESSRRPETFLSPERHVLIIPLNNPGNNLKLCKLFTTALLAPATSGVVVSPPLWGAGGTRQSGMGQVSNSKKKKSPCFQDATANPGSFLSSFS